MTQSTPQARTSSFTGNSLDPDLDLLFGDDEPHAVERESSHSVGSPRLITWAWEADYGF